MSTQVITLNPAQLHAVKPELQVASKQPNHDGSEEPCFILNFTPQFYAKYGQSISEIRYWKRRCLVHEVKAAQEAKKKKIKALAQWLNEHLEFHDEVEHILVKERRPIFRKEVEATLKAIKQRHKKSVAPMPYQFNRSFIQSQ